MLPSTLVRQVVAGPCVGWKAHARWTTASAPANASPSGARSEDRSTAVHRVFGGDQSGIRRASPTTDATSGSAARARTTAVPTLPVAPVTTTLKPVALLTCVLPPAAVHADRPSTRAGKGRSPDRDGGITVGAALGGTEGGRLSASGSTGLQPNDRPCGRMVRPGDTVPSAPTPGSTVNHPPVFRRMSPFGVMCITLSLRRARVIGPHPRNELRPQVLRLQHQGAQPPPARGTPPGVRVRLPPQPLVHLPPPCQGPLVRFRRRRRRGLLQPAGLGEAVVTDQFQQFPVPAQDGVVRRGGRPVLVGGHGQCPGQRRHVAGDPAEPLILLFR